MSKPTRFPHSLPHQMYNFGNAPVEIGVEVRAVTAQIQHNSTIGVVLSPWNSIISRSLSNLNSSIHLSQISSHIKPGEFDLSQSKSTNAMRDAVAAQENG